MPEPKNDSKRAPLKNLPPDKFQPRIVLIWLAIVAAVLAILYLSPSRHGAPVELKIQQVVDLAQGGRIKEGMLRPSGGGWYVITGKLLPVPAAVQSEPVEAAPAEGPAGVAKPAAEPAEPALQTFTAKGILTDTNLEKLQATKLFAEEPSSNVWTSLLANLLPFLLIIGLLYFLFVRQLKNAGRGAMSFGKSKAKLLTRERDRITFGNVAGCDEAKEEVSEVVDFLKDPKRFQKMGGKIPKGILLVGPPGTGKTLLAKAVAGEADVPFFSVSGSDFVEMFVGVGASRVRDMFEQGRKNAPCIIFIDEIDAVGRQRGAGLGGGNDEREQTLNSMLVEMDGFDTSEGVIIIAATNRPDVLDNALLRPGRFDRQIHVDLPDLIGREQILKVHAKKISLSDDVDLMDIARATAGLAGADLANLLNEAALLATRRNKKRVERIDIEDAREKVLYGRERRRLMDDDEKKMVAYHEAGHALVQTILSDGHTDVHKVTIIPRGGALGSMMPIPKKDLHTNSFKSLLNRIAVGLGGRVAEELALKDISNGASGDIKHITKVARHMVCDWGMSPLGPISYGDNQDTVFLGRDIARNEHMSEETARRIDGEIHRIIDEQLKRCREIITTHRTALDKIAEALLEHETIEGVHIKEIVEFGEIRSPVTRVAPPALPDQGKDKPAAKKPADKDAPDPLGGAAAPSPA